MVMVVVSRNMFLSNNPFSSPFPPFLSRHQIAPDWGYLDINIPYLEDSNFVELGKLGSRTTKIKILKTGESEESEG